jgi:hypothetical protein
MDQFKMIEVTIKAILEDDKEVTKMEEGLKEIDNLEEIRKYFQVIMNWWMMENQIL